jgi:surfeit locus 1 family protein
MTAGMLIVLLGLGTWQVKRLFWKQALLAQIDRAEAAAPLPLSQLSSPSPFAKVSVTGTFLAGVTALYGADVRTIGAEPAMGARLIEPMRATSGDVILVDRGWVPLSRPEPIDQPAGTVTISGYVRFGDSPHWFSGKDDLAARRFYTLDPKAIGVAVGQPDVRPFVLVALTSAPGPAMPADRWPDPARYLPRPPNNHLSYAITWYGLAMALLAIFIVWARKGSLA